MNIYYVEFVELDDGLQYLIKLRQLQFSDFSDHEYGHLSPISDRSPAIHHASKRDALCDISNLSDHCSKRSRIDSLSSNGILPLSVTMPPHLIEKQKKAINGYFNYDATIFIQQARQGWHLIVLGLYPI